MGSNGIESSYGTHVQGSRTKVDCPILGYAGGAQNDYPPELCFRCAVL